MIEMQLKHIGGPTMISYVIVLSVLCCGKTGEITANGPTTTLCPTPHGLTQAQTLFLWRVPGAQNRGVHGLMQHLHNTMVKTSKQLKILRVTGAFTHPPHPGMHLKRGGGGGRSESQNVCINNGPIQYFLL